MDPAQHERLHVAYMRHYERLVRVAAGLCLDPALAEDIVQEAFVRMAPRVEDIADEAVGAYLRASVVNLWRNRLRRLALERRHSHRDQESLDPTLGVDERDEMWQMLQGLSDRQRACVVLRFYEDLSEREVAQVLRCSTGAVKTHTSRALHKLVKEVPRDA